jgi:hypothetical protein
MRNVAYPFDWVLSSPRLVMDCLRDDFQTFLDSTQHITVEPGISSNHLIYGAMVWGKNFDRVFNQHLTFAHKDVTTADDYVYYYVYRYLIRMNRDIRLIKRMESNI